MVEHALRNLSPDGDKNPSTLNSGLKGDLVSPEGFEGPLGGQ